MIYQAYQAYADGMTPVRGIAKSVVAVCDKAHPAVGEHISVRRVAAANGLLALVRLTHERPHFGIEVVRSGGRFHHWHAYCVPECMHLRTSHGLTE